MAASDSPALPQGQPLQSRLGVFARRPLGADALIALVVFALEVVGILSRRVNETGEFSFSMLGAVPAAIYLLLAASSIVLLWRRTQPLPVLVATLSASIVWDLLDLDGGPSGAIFVALYGVGRYITDNRRTALAVSAAMALVVADDLIEGEDLSVIGLSLGFVVFWWYVGQRVRERRNYLSLIEERAAYLEREQHAEAQRAVDAERARIARELHDVVAHRVSMITVQAGAAQTVADTDPQRAVGAMKAVEEAGREALEELRQILGVLRSDSSREALTPTRGLADIDELVAEMNRAGVGVSLSRANAPEDLPARVDLAAYRIVQEALTNVVKHAGPSAQAEVRVVSDDQHLVIEVTDDGSGDSALPGSGQGLIGMRERTALLGGTFEAGPRPGGGFRVVARLPLEREPS